MHLGQIGGAAVTRQPSSQRRQALNFNAGAGLEASVGNRFEAIDTLLTLGRHNSGNADLQAIHLSRTNVDRKQSDWK